VLALPSSLQSGLTQLTGPSNRDSSSNLTDDLINFGERRLVVVFVYVNNPRNVSLLNLRAGW
jgi:hypothetical protein